MINPSSWNAYLPLSSMPTEQGRLPSPPKTSVLVRRGRQPTPTKTLHMPSHFSSVRAGDTHINTYLSSLHRVYDSHPTQQYRMNLTFMVGRQGGPTRQSPGGHLYGRSLNSYPLQDLGFPLESTEVISPVSSLGNPPQWQLVRRSKITECQLSSKFHDRCEVQDTMPRHWFSVYRVHLKHL